MTYYRKLRMESFKRAMFASRFSRRYVAPSLRLLARTAPAPKQLSQLSS